MAGNLTAQLELVVLSGIFDAKHRQGEIVRGVEIVVMARTHVGSRSLTLLARIL